MTTHILPCAAALTLILISPAAGADPPSDELTAEVALARADAALAESAWTTAVDPKPLSEVALGGIDWLVEQQRPDGGWSQGEESASMGAAGSDRSNVGDTCAAALALVRAGSTPSVGPHPQSVLAAVDFLCTRIETSDPDSLSVTDVQGTRLQAKLGPHVDTFLACLLLSEIQGRMPEPSGDARIAAALTTVVGKIQEHQRADGTWDDRGWAPALSRSVAAKGLNRASQGGQYVAGDVMAKITTRVQEQVGEDGITLTGRGSAGVALYEAASVVSTLSDDANSDALRKQELLASLAGADEGGRKAIESELADIEADREASASARGAVVDRLDDAAFLAGFGSNGGEEFLSYMNISEGLVVEGGEAWRDWDEQITANLERIQNADGSWSGHHCITGRTFCTSTALLVLMADRTPVPVTEAQEEGAIETSEEPAVDEDEPEEASPTESDDAEEG
jgi:hypothetical protein